MTKNPEQQGPNDEKDTNQQKNELVEKLFAELVSGNINAVHEYEELNGELPPGVEELIFAKFFTYIATDEPGYWERVTGRQSSDDDSSGILH